MVAVSVDEMAADMADDVLILYLLYCSLIHVAVEDMTQPLFGGRTDTYDGYVSTASKGQSGGNLRFLAHSIGDIAG